MRELKRREEEAAAKERARREAEEAEREAAVRVAAQAASAEATSADKPDSGVGGAADERPGMLFTSNPSSCKYANMNTCTFVYNKQPQVDVKPH